MWQDEGSCVDSDTNIFFDIYEENSGVRKAVDSFCSECPVRRQCFAQGISGKEWGVWGGVYLEEGVISKEFNDHKTKKDWHGTWQALTMG